MDIIIDFFSRLIQRGATAGFLPSSLRYAFVANALLGVLIASPVLGVLGTMVVSKRLAFFSNAIGHAAITGIGLGILLGEPVSSPYISLFSFAIVFGLMMNFTKNRTDMSQDTLIGIFLSTSLAVGTSLLLFVTRSISIHVLDNIMFGSILTVNSFDITILFTISVITLVTGLIYFNRMVIVSFNSTLANVRGINSKLMDYIFIGMITIITVASVKIIGAVLVEALLLIPAASARNVSRSLKGFVILSAIFAAVSSVLGIILPMELDIPIPSGGAIIIVSATIFFLTIPIGSCLEK